MDECKPLLSGAVSRLRSRGANVLLCDLRGQGRSGQGLTLVPVSAQLEHLLPLYNSTELIPVCWSC